MAKIKNKNKEDKIRLRLDESNMADRLYQDSHRRAEDSKVSIAEQAYLSGLAAAHKEYGSSMRKIKEDLALAEQGYDLIREKGVTDEITAAIEKISKVRLQQIAINSSYTTQLSQLDSKLMGTYRESGNIRELQIGEDLDARLISRHGAVMKKKSELEAQYAQIESDLHVDETGKHKEPTSEEILEARRKQDDLLAEKQRLMTDYIDFFHNVVAKRDNMLRGEGNEAPKAAETQARVETIQQSFDQAEKTSHPKWEKFKSLPVISALTAGGAKIGKKISPKFSGLKEDLLAGYAEFKTLRESRKVEKALRAYDKVQGLEGDESYLAKFKRVLDAPDTEPAKSSEAKTEPANPDFLTIPEENSPVEESTDKAAAAQPEAGDAKPEVSEPEAAEAPKPHVMTAEERHAVMIKNAENQAVIKSLQTTGLDKMLNDYYWGDIATAHNIVQDLSQSDNAMNDLTLYSEKVRTMISHWPDEKIRTDMTEKLNEAMTAIYQEKTTAGKRVIDAEARIRDSQAFLDSLCPPDEPEHQDDQTTL